MTTYHLSRSPDCLRLIRAVLYMSMTANRVAAIAFRHDGRWQVFERHLYGGMVDTATEAIVAMVRLVRSGGDG